MKRTVVMILTAFLLSGCTLFTGDKPKQECKNVIVFLGDGMGYPCYNLMKLPTYKNTVEMPLQTCSLKGGAKAHYDAEAAQKNPKWRYRFPTDSAAAATALSSGEKVNNGRLNYREDGTHLVTMAEKFKAQGKQVAIVSSMPLSHATPAGYGAAHNVSRENYAQIANEMFSDTVIDILIGGGHPFYDNEGVKREKSTNNFQYVGGKETWTKLCSGTHPGNWTLCTSPDFGAKAGRLLYVAPVRETFQYRRKKGELWNDARGTLEACTRGAFTNLVERHAPFFMMVEGGAIDCANHDNNESRMREELFDFESSILYVYEQLSANTKNNVSPNWDDTIVVIVADHETGGMDVEEDGSLKYTTDYHTNVPVPLRVDGAHADAFNKLEKLPFGGIDNTVLPKVLLNVTGVEAGELSEIK